jgi:hypothetical protein
MAVLLFVLAIIASFLVVRLGAVALELTGMEPRQARFQSLSAFSGTGFTTKESELILHNPARRKVVQLLIVGGNAGLVTLIATLAQSLGATATTHEAWELFGGAVRIPGRLVPYFDVVLIILFLVVLYRVSQTRPVARLIHRVLKAFLVRQGLVQKVSFEEVVLNAQGHGISQIQINADNPLVNRTLAQSGLRAHGILVLSIERGEEILLSPKGDDRVLLEDRLTCFGPLTAIREVAVAAAERDAPMETEENVEEG